MNAYAPDCRSKSRKISTDASCTLQGSERVAVDCNACRTIDEFVEWVETPMGGQVKPSLRNQHHTKHNRLTNSMNALTSALPQFLR